MQKSLFFIAMFFITLASNAQDTIVGFSFHTNDTNALKPNYGLTSNFVYSIFKEGSASISLDSISFTNGVTTGDYAATTTNWDNGADTKYWAIKFKAAGYTDFKISSKQRCGGTNGGPVNFKLQWKLNASGTYSDVPNGNIVVANNWTTGVINQLAVPISNQGTNSIFIRWLMTSNTDVNGGNVSAAGISKIDDIIVTATNSVGIEETIYKDAVSIYPNPSNGIINFSNQNAINEISIFNAMGLLIYKSNVITTHIDLSSYGKGIYFLKIDYNNKLTNTTKIMIR